MDHFSYNSADETATAALGAALGEFLPDGTTVSLRGTLGAGKTRLVQAIARAVGIDDRQAVSPTFVLIQEYHGRRTIYHIDAYRLRDEDEFLELGPDEYFDSGDGLVLIEWADRVESCLPRERIDIEIEVTGQESRRFQISAIGTRYSPTIERLRAWAGNVE